MEALPHFPGIHRAERSPSSTARHPALAPEGPRIVATGGAMRSYRERIAKPVVSRPLARPFVFNSRPGGAAEALPHFPSFIAPNVHRQARPATRHWPRRGHGL